jgi:class 3 adenylate cyclase
MGFGFGQLFSRYFDQKKHPISSELYRLWFKLSVPNYTRYMNLFCLFSMVLLIPFDYLLFEDWTFYSSLRVPIIVLNLFIQVRGSTKNPGPLLVGIPLLVSIVYAYFLFAAPVSDKQIVFLGNLMVVIFCGFLFYRFWNAQGLFNFVGIAVSVLGALISPDRYQFFLLLGISHVLTYFTAFFLRRDFTESLTERFHNLSMLIPVKEAKIVSVTNNRSELEQNLMPRERYSVCLCADWRNFQKMTQQKSAQEVSNYFRVFYDLVYSELNRVIPEGTFYVNWVADELFVIFYDDNGNDGLVNQKASEFALRLVTDVHRRVSAELGFDLHFDVGVSGGRALLGLQGPSAQKKTTVTGEHPGVAKRLQTLAKTIWNQKNTRGPVLLVQDSVWESAKSLSEQLALLSYAETSAAEVKDLQNVKSFVIHYDFGVHRNRLAS